MDELAIRLSSMMGKENSREINRIMMRNRYIGFHLSVADKRILQGAYPQDELLCLFRENDRRIENGMLTFAYRCPVSHVCDRLEAMGFGLSQARSELSRFVDEEIKTELRYELRFKDAAKEFARKTAQDTACQVLRDATFDDWRAAYVRLLCEWEAGSFHESSHAGPLDRYMYSFASEDSDAPLNDIKSPFGNKRSTFRVLFSTFDSDAEVCLDYSELLESGWVPRDYKLTEVAIENLVSPGRATEPTIVLTEGSTDTRILSQSLEILFPHLLGFYAFLDHEAFNPPGGAGNLLNLCKGLAAARIANRVVVLFDNDSAGRVSAKALREQKLPSNFRVMNLPPLHVANAYPTIGPTGSAESDVNGRAATIELYCGKKALTGATGEIIPVRWTGFEYKLCEYQGEIVDKRSIQERFLELLRRSTEPAHDPEFDDMRLLLRGILRAFIEP